VCSLTASAQYNVPTGLTVTFTGVNGTETRVNFYVSAQGLPSSNMQGREVLLTYTTDESGYKVYTACEDSELSASGSGSCGFYASIIGAVYTFTASFLGSYDGAAGKYWFLPSSLSWVGTCSPVCSGPDN
jgi:hypothetical protein